jgi:hypothetical protein
MAQHETTSTDADTVAIRHHVDTLILKLAAAQAGSIHAVRESRRHAEAVLEILNGSGEVVCEHARFSGVAQSDEEWRCNGCGASWPKNTRSHTVHASAGASAP